MMRISMSLPKKLLADFDEVLKERGYQSRSKGIRDALQDYIVRYQWMNSMEGQRIGIITIIYDHHYTGVMENLAEIQHSFRNEINTSMHIHMTDKYCMEIVVVNGDIAEIRDLTERIMRLKGVEHVKLTSTANGEDFKEVAEGLGVEFNSTNELIDVKNVDGGRSDRAYEMESGEISDIFVSDNGDCYYILKLNEKSDGKVNYVSITIPFTEFEKRLNNVREENRVNEYIELTDNFDIGI